MKRKFLRPLGLFLFLNLLYSPLLNAQNSGTKSSSENKNQENPPSLSYLNPWFSALNISIESGASYARIGEFVYKGSPQGKKVPLSRLDWDKILMWKTGLNLHLDIKRWSIFLGSSVALPVFHTAFMQDRDWKGAPGVLTNLSEHPVRRDSHFSTEAALAYRIRQGNVFSAGAGAGFEFINTGITAYDGEIILPVPDKKKLSGDVISYKQKLYVPWLRGFIEWKPFSVFEADFLLSFAPVTFAHSLDTHYSYNSAGVSLKPAIEKEFSDRMYGFAGVKGELVFRFNLLPKTKQGSAGQSSLPSLRHAVELRANAVYLPELNGKTYSRTFNASPFIYNKGAAAGTSYCSFGISLAYCIRMR